MTATQSTQLHATRQLGMHNINRSGHGAQRTLLWVRGRLVRSVQSVRLVAEMSSSRPVRMRMGVSPAGKVATQYNHTLLCLPCVCEFCYECEYSLRSHFMVYSHWIVSTHRRTCLWLGTASFVISPSVRLPQLGARSKV